MRKLIVALLALALLGGASAGAASSVHHSQPSAQIDGWTWDDSNHPAA